MRQRFRLPAAAVLAAALLLPTLAGGLYWDSTQLYTLGELTVIPEPSTWAMLLGGLGMLVMGQRIRRRPVKA